MPWIPEWILIFKKSWVWFLFTSIVIIEGIIIIFEVLGAAISLIRITGLIVIPRSKFLLFDWKWMILVSKEVWMTVLIIIFKCCPSVRVAMPPLSSSIPHILHFPNMILELFLHHIQYNITIPITPCPWTFEKNHKTTEIQQRTICERQCSLIETARKDFIFSI